MAADQVAGLGQRGRAQENPPSSDERQLTLIEHLEELRRVLLISLVAWVVATAVAFVFNHQMIWILERPLHMALRHTRSPFGQSVVITSPIEGLSIPFKIAAAAGVILSLPITVWQIWTFVKPGLRRSERNLAFPFIFGTLFFFALGGLFAYFILPIGLTFLATFLGGNAVYLPDLNAYLTFLALVVLVFGVTFEMPVVLCTLGAVGILSSAKLRRWRKAAYFIMVGVALIVTPGADPFTPTFLSIALLLLYEGSILVIAHALHR
ncbi:MAG TPA: twin-arginine translocase subunit TatC [Candidatus Dormibacteraeota bacterium]|nr:twin-arginine translocase subunit TatC [Candidatus Dormibacteraeota bacterium]